MKKGMLFWLTLTRDGRIQTVCEGNKVGVNKVGVCGGYKVGVCERSEDGASVGSAVGIIVVGEPVCGAVDGQFVGFVVGEDVTAQSQEVAAQVSYMSERSSVAQKTFAVEEVQNAYVIDVAVPTENLEKLFVVDE